MMVSAFRTIGVLGIFGILLLLQGCREEEQNQILIHEKGVYQGQQDRSLEAEQLQELRSRAGSQKF